MIYYYDLTILIEERLEDKLINCEIIEVSDFDFEEAKESITAAVGLTFTLIDMDRMVNLMQECQRLPVTPLSEFEIKGNATYTIDQNQLKGLDLHVFRIPRTKWCGKGDKAKTYYHLGKDIEIDKCCRTHDLCPSNIPPKTTRYNLTNTDSYAKSHCTCDRNFRECLKNANTKYQWAYATKVIFFGLSSSQCFENGPKGMEFKSLPIPGIPIRTLVYPLVSRLKMSLV